MSAAARNEPLTLLIAALGGQGGGVLADWIVAAARADGFLAQATSTPGVSQRTGATTYYIELVRMPAANETPPVLALAPLPGQVDVLVCAELLEVARMLERGMCTPARTTVVASTHRVYTTREKMSAGDGRYDAARIVAAVRELARDAVLLDLDALRARHQAAISATLFGALAGSGALPLSRAACEGAIRAAGKGVDASLAAFAAARALAEARGKPPAAKGVATEPTLSQLPAALAQRIGALPPDVAELARHGAALQAEFQDPRYALRYVERIERIVAVERAARPDHAVAREVVRQLARWMAYDDVIRVAWQKVRAARFTRIRAEARAREGEVVRVFDYFKPGPEEIAAILPRWLGAWWERRAARKGVVRGRGITLQATSFSGALALRLTAVLKPLRPRSLRFAREQRDIDAWLASVETALRAGDAEGALALARLPRVIKGYGATHASGTAEYARLLAAYRAGSGAGTLALELDAALAAAPPAAAAPVVRPLVRMDRAGRERVAAGH